jgi:hypothetical protein
MAARSRRLLMVLGAMAVLALMWTTPAGAAPHGLVTGFNDFDAFQQLDGPERDLALQHARDADASMVRLLVSWSEVAPVTPPNIDATRDPNWTGYRWDATDSAVRAVSAAGLQIVFSATAAPAWAEGAGRPAMSSSAPPGTWRPSPEAFGAFAQAAARRYSGSYPDPLRPGSFLPRVRFWQGWNEPNLSNFLTPQWRRVGRKVVPASPDLYRKLINAFYGGVKSVSSGNFVVSAGTAPFGDPGHGKRMFPALFIRSLFCVKGRAKPRATKCPGGPVHFDALAHHPFPIGPPRRHAINADDVVIPDMSKLTRPLAVALRAGNVLPKRHKQIWATEMSWDSNPPDPQGVPANLQARYMEGAFSTLWSEGVNTILWWQMRDQAVGPGFQFSQQSGVYLRGPTVAQDQKKPSFTAFRFPFTAYLRHGVAQLWGLAPNGGSRVVIEERRGSRWTPVASLRARRDRLFLGRLRVRPRTVLRAHSGADTSLTWTVFSPS